MVNEHMKINLKNCIEMNYFKKVIPKRNCMHFILNSLYVFGAYDECCTFIKISHCLKNIHNDLLNKFYNLINKILILNR